MYKVTAGILYLNLDMYKHLSMRRENFKMCSNLREFLLYFAVDFSTGFIKDRFEDRIINIHINLYIFCRHFVCGNQCTNQ